MPLIVDIQSVRMALRVKFRSMILADRSTYMTAVGLIAAWRDGNVLAMYIRERKKT
jgi:hypothetical protein